jgi:hypothetical protein
LRSPDPRLIGRALRLDRAERARAVRALAWLIAAGVVVRLVGIARLTRAIARIPAGRSHRSRLTPAECATAIGRAARLWPSRCLPQAIAGYCLLRRAGVHATLTLGARVEGSRLDAHAWLEAGGVMVTGGERVHEYAPLIPAERPIR